MSVQLVVVDGCVRVVPPYPASQVGPPVRLVDEHRVACDFAEVQLASVEGDVVADFHQAQEGVDFSDHPFELGVGFEVVRFAYDVFGRLSAGGGEDGW